MNGDALIIVQAIGDLKAELKEEIGEVKTQIAALSGLRNELLGDGGRVVVIEDRFKDLEKWNNIKHIVMVPLLLTVHKILQVFGIKI